MSMCKVVGWTDRHATARSSHPLRFGREGRSCYPALHADPELPLDLLLIDSNRRRATSPITNAIGYVGDRQLSLASDLLRGRRGEGRHLIVVLHHHLALPRLSPGGLAGTYFQMCIDAASVLAFAREYRASAIFHGHLHMPYVLRPKADAAAPLIASCGSALFPAIGPNAAIGTATAFGLRFASGGGIEILTYAAGRPDWRPGPQARSGCGVSRR